MVRHIHKYDYHYFNTGYILGAGGQSMLGEKRGFLDKIRGLFGVSRPVSRKTSGASLAGILINIISINKPTFYIIL